MLIKKRAVEQKFIKLFPIEVDDTETGKPRYSFGASNTGTNKRRDYRLDQEV